MATSDNATTSTGLGEDLVLEPGDGDGFVVLHRTDENSSNTAKWTQEPCWDEEFVSVVLENCIESDGTGATSYN
eukprot:scaffold1019_cov172-Amphora_coffeaeformis.AAC.1